MKGNDMIEDNDEPVAEVTQEEFIEPSPVGDELMRHYAALGPCERIPVAKSYTLPMADYRAPLLVGLLKQISRLNRVLVLIEHPDMGLYEIRRLPNGYDAGFFYRTINAPANMPENVGTDEEAELREKLLETFRNALLASSAETATYDPKLSLEMKNENSVTYSYLHRRLAAVAAFRKSKGGATQALKETLDALCDDGIIERVSQSYAELTFNVTGKVYRLVTGQ